MITIDENAKGMNVGNDDKGGIDERAKNRHETTD
jgi:hypothetical protein